jgi:mono/diheme cytochrome c family protein
LSFCTTDDCVARINDNKTDQSQWRYPAYPFTGSGTFGAAVPFSAADDARDHWLAAGEPHCADCHSAPYVEQSGNITPYPPFNYPAKASLSRYTRGHQDISCQGCHESIHGLYPVGPAIDNTSYAQAAALNADGSHGPIKCGACHTVNGQGVPTWIGVYDSYGVPGAILPQIGSFDDAVTWAHTYTAEANVLNSTCQNCHGVNGNFNPNAINTSSTSAQWTKVAKTDANYLGHAQGGLTSRLMMDNAETLAAGGVFDSTNGSDGVCVGCHTDKSAQVDCGKATWLQHLTMGRVAESVWEKVSAAQTGGTCGW